MNSFARVLSVLFHPLLFPTYLFVLFSFTFPSAFDPIPAPKHGVFIILIFIVTFALPALNIWILRTFRIVRSAQMEERRERIFPFVLISVIYVAITYMFYWKSRIDPGDNFMKLMIIIDALVVMSALATMFFKVSIHSLAIWGVIGIIIPMNKISELNSLFLPAVVCVLLAGFIMSARLVLNVHTLKEVLWGSILGLATSICGMLILFQA